MKKISIIICCIIGAIAIGGGIILFMPKSPIQKISNDKILFVYSETQNFYSNKKYDNSLNNYTLTISNNVGVDFENFDLTSTTNVDKTVQHNNCQIVVNFKITSGTTFSFTLTTDNFEEISDTKTAIEYIQSTNIQLKIATTQNGEYKNFQNNSIYLIEDEYKAQAFQDEFFSEYFIKPDYISTTSSTFDISVAETGCLSFDETTKKLTATKTGSSYVTVAAQDGSNAKKQFLFTAKNVEATNVANLPTETIELDVDHNPSVTLQPTPVPSYAKGYSITFESSNSAVFIITNQTLTAVAKGDANLIVKLNGTEVKSIPVTVSAIAEPTFNVSLQQTTKTALGDKVEFANDACTLHTANIVENYQTLIFTIGYENLGITQSDLNYTITSDDNNIVIDGEGEDGFEPGTTTACPFKIFVDTTKTGTITINFSATTQAGSFEKSLMITLINS